MLMPLNLDLNLRRAQEICPEDSSGVWSRGESDPVGSASLNTWVFQPTVECGK